METNIQPGSNTFAFSCQFILVQTLHYEIFIVSNNLRNELSSKMPAGFYPSRLNSEASGETKIQALYAPNSNGYHCVFWMY